MRENTPSNLKENSYIKHYAFNYYITSHKYWVRRGLDRMVDGFTDLQLSVHSSTITTKVVSGEVCQVVATFSGYSGFLNQ
jgi:hypothetical protein